MIRDKMVFGGMIGFLANVAMNFFQYPLWKLKVIEHPLAHYAGSMFMDVETLHHTLLGSFISFVANSFYSAFLGIFFVYTVYFTGGHAFIVKGLLFGAFVWLFSFGGLRSLPMVQLREYISSQALYYLFIHLVFGLALGLLINKFGEPALRKE